MNTRVRINIAVTVASLSLAATTLGENSEQEIERLRSAATKGDAKSQYELGMKYKDGDGVPPDKIEGYKWLHKAVEQGYTAAVTARYEISQQMTQKEIALAKGSSIQDSTVTSVPPVNPERRAEPRLKARESTTDICRSGESEDRSFYLSRL